MIIALEGLPCAGKSSILETLLESEAYTCIPEFIIDTGPEITTTMCQVNDMAKSQLAVLEQKNGHVIIDRSYLSTLVYTYAEGDKKYQEMEAWYKSAVHRGLIIEPDVIIFSAVSASTCVERAKNIGRYSEAFAWFQESERAITMYNKLLSDPGRATRTIAIDSEKMSVQAAATYVQEYLSNKGGNNE